jgi:hypothetical protein
VGFVEEVETVFGVEWKCKNFRIERKIFAAWRGIGVRRWSQGGVGDAGLGLRQKFIGIGDEVEEGLEVGFVFPFVEFVVECAFF